MRVALSIARSDSGGGGIQADLLTFAAQCSHGTTITAQDTVAVTAWRALPPAMFPLAALITPNVLEIEALLSSIKSVGDMREGVFEFKHLGFLAVLSHPPGHGNGPVRHLSRGAVSTLGRATGSHKRGILGSD